MVRPRLADMMGANASDVEPRLHFAALSGLWSDVCGTENRNGSRMKSDGLRCHMRYPQWLLVPKAIVFESLNPSLLGPKGGFRGFPVPLSVLSVLGILLGKAWL